MNFTPKQHLKIGNYVKYVDEILHKCEKGIEYCKMCPNEFVCSELEKDDFGLQGSTISEILAAIQQTLSKIPGYLNPDKRSELREQIKKYIDESPSHERKMWEDSILGLLLNEKLANPAYKPHAQVGQARVLLSCTPEVGFSVCLRCLLTETKDLANALPEEIVTDSIMSVSQGIRPKHAAAAVLCESNRIKYRLEDSVPEIPHGCDMRDIGLAAALCYYSALMQMPISGNIAVTGRVDGQGQMLQTSSLNGKIETVLRELHFIEAVIIPQGASFTIPVPHTIKVIGVDTLAQALDIVFKK